MPTWARAVMFVLLFGFVGAEAQINPVQTSFAIVTPEFGNTNGLFAVESLFNRNVIGLQRTDMIPAPLLVTGSFTVTIANSSADTAGLAIVNPNAVPVNVRVSITGPLGTEVLTQTVTVLPRAQLTRFLSEIFGVPPRVSSPGLMTVIAEAPVAIQPINFTDAAFASTPVVSLTNPFPLSTTIFTPAATVTRTATTGSTTTGGTGAVGSTPTFIGGDAAVLFPQVVNGGGWFTELTIFNLGLISQNVRIDFFDPTGTAIDSIVGINIPSRGLIVFSTETRRVVTR